MQIILNKLYEDTHVSAWADNDGLGLLIINVRPLLNCIKNPQKSSYCYINEATGLPVILNTNPFIPQSKHWKYFPLLAMLYNRMSEKC